MQHSEAQLTGQDSPQTQAPWAVGAREFDFLMGNWNVANRRLRARLKGCTEWDRFDATNAARPLLGGIANEDEFVTDYMGGFVGMTFRFFNRLTGLWSIYWADSRHGTLEPPVHGRFDGATAVFEGEDVLDGVPIRVRFLWSRRNPDQPRWEQAFSNDGGATWETNWIMEFTRP